MNRARTQVGRQLVLRCALPVDDIAEPPWVLIQLDLQLAVLVDGELASGVKNAAALALVLIIQLQLARGEIERLRLGVVVRFTKSDLAVGDEANGPPSRRGNHADVREVVAQGSWNLNAANRRGFLQRIHQSLILALLE